MPGFVLTTKAKNSCKGGDYLRPIFIPKNYNFPFEWMAFLELAIQKTRYKARAK